MIPVDGSDIRKKHHLGMYKTFYQNGISTTNLNWWSPDFWSINRIIHHLRDLSSGISLKKKDWPLEGGIASRKQGWRWQRQS